MTTNIGNSEKPLKHHAESLSFDPQTADPSSTEKGEMWLRTDLDGEVADQLATLRFDDGSTVRDIPVLDLYGDHNYHGVLGIDINGQRGIIPVDDPEEVTLPELAVQLGNSRLGFDSLQDPDAIPDSVVSRTDDNSSSSAVGPRGIQIETSQKWPKMGGTISANTSDATTAYIYRSSDGLLMGQTDISGLVAGDSFSIDLDNELQPDTTYNFELDDEGSGFTQGINDSPDTPYTSDDGNLTILGGGFDNTESTTNPRCLVTVGSVATD